VALPAFTYHAAVCRAAFDIFCWPHPQQQSYSSGFAAVGRAAFDRYFQLAASTAAKLQQRVWAPAETDGRTDNQQMHTDPAPHTMWALPINRQSCKYKYFN